MEIVTAKTTRRSTRLRVQIPVTMTSLDRRHAFVAGCVALVVSPQGAGLEASQALPVETPVMLSGLPGGASASARVASCLPLGKDEKRFLIGISLYNPGNIWGIANPPEDWECAPSGATSAAEASAGVAKPVPSKSAEVNSAKTTGGQPNSKEAWPYNIFSGNTEAHPGRK
jgi:hypothetical protein